MSEPLAYLNGRFLPPAELSVPVYDTGFVQGVTVTEQIRTFGGKLFRFPQHMERLQHSLEIVGIDPGIELAQLAKAAEDLVSHNHGLLTPGDDLGLSMFVTPGGYPTLAPPGGSPPLVAMHTYCLPFQLWFEKYEVGQALAVTDVRQVPSECWPAALKCRSRMHYYLADRQANLKIPGARALLLDRHQKVIEASTANLVTFRREEGFLSPPKAKILPGVSVATLAELARHEGIPFHCRDLEVDDVANADEVLLCSTSSCLLPVVSLDGRSIGAGKPGPTFQRMLHRWSELVGVDIRQQAREFSAR
jgi:branched-subunit amino acid aminotransferase/4-amino-4-deoxychorismate lyase